jgi:hypothetical protein
MFGDAFGYRCARSIVAECRFHTVFGLRNRGAVRPAAAFSNFTEVTRAMPPAQANPKRSRRMSSRLYQSLPWLPKLRRNRWRDLVRAARPPRPAPAQQRPHFLHPLLAPRNKHASTNRHLDPFPNPISRVPAKPPSSPLLVSDPFSHALHGGETHPIFHFSEIDSECCMHPET